MIVRYTHYISSLLLIQTVSAQYYAGQFGQQQQSGAGFQRAPCQTGGCNQNYGYYQNRQQQSCPACAQQFTSYSYQQPQAPLPQPLEAPPTVPVTLAPMIPQRPVEEKPIRIPIPEEPEICPPCPATPAATVCPTVTCPQLSCPAIESNKYEEHQTVRNDDVESEQEVDPAQLDHEMLAMKDQEKKYRHRVAAARFSLRRRKRAAVDVVSLKNKCNNDQLKKIITQSFSKNIVETKVAIAERAAREIGGQFNVICTTGVFSYYAAARLFCEVSKKNISCFVFRHDSIAPSRQPHSRSALEQVAKDSSAEIGVRKFDEAERRADVDESTQAARRSEKATTSLAEGEIIYKSLEPKTVKMSRLSRFISMKSAKKPRMNGGSAGDKTKNQYY